MSREPRIDEREALEVICALEEVDSHKWLCAGSKRTPDLEATIGGKPVFVEVTMHTSRADQELWGASEKMRSPERSEKWPQLCVDLSRQWKVVVTDHHVESRDRSRTLKELVEALIPALLEIESTNAPPEVMQRRANELLDPDPYNPYLQGSKSSWFVDGWLEASASGVDFDEFVEASAEQGCGYWYPVEIADCLTKGVRPRHVRVLNIPRVVGRGCGGVTVFVSTGHGCAVEALDYLVPAIQSAISHKADRGQLANVTGQKWLVVAIDGGCAATQLEELCGRAIQPARPELGAVTFPDFDEVWTFARTFDGTHHAALRLSRSEPTARCFKVPRSTNQAQTSGGVDNDVDGAPQA